MFGKTSPLPTPEMLLKLEEKRAIYQQAVAKSQENEWREKDAERRQQALQMAAAIGTPHDELIQRAEQIYNFHLGMAKFEKPKEPGE